MAGSKVINQQSFHDGKVVLYQLEDRPKKLWLCRIKVPNGTGYVYRGTGTSDPYEARKKADEILDEMKVRVKLGQSVTGIRFAKMVGEFETHINAKGTPTKWEAAVLAFVKTYAEPYFTNNKITDINPGEVAKFFDWRRVNSKKKAPTESTILHETSEFRTFLNWCHKRGLIDKTVSIETPKHEAGRRPDFDEKDWKKLLKKIAPWLKEAKSISTTAFHDRRTLGHYVVILGYTGIRVGEARGLRWCDIDTEPSEDATKPYLIIKVTGKTGSRDVVARIPEVREAFGLLWKARVTQLNGKKPELSEFVFCHPGGKPIQSFKKGFNNLIKAAEVEFDRNGDRRTIYSLRHTYATSQLHAGVNHYVLARNMGTSVKMLEQFYGHTSNRAMASELTKARKETTNKLPWE